MLNQAWAFFLKELKLEFRQKYALGGLLLYVVSSVFVIYFSITYNHATGDITHVIWSILYWLVILFASVNAATRSFTKESEGLMLYYYTTIKPTPFILGKLLYNFIITLVLSLISAIIFTITIGNPIQNMGIFLGAILLGGTAYAFVFTLISAIAAKAGNSSTMSVILGFPLIIPLIIFIVKVFKGALTQSPNVNFVNDLIILALFNVIIIILSLILFPYIWRD